jgi:hypothetical protein
MAAVISRIPHAAATIVPFDVRSRVESLTRRGQAAKPGADGAGAMPQPATPTGPSPEPTSRTAVPAGNGPASGRAEAEPGQPIAAGPTAPASGGGYEHPAPRRGVTPIGSLTRPGRALAEGRVHTVEIRPVEHNTVLACDVEDSTGQLTALFYGRSNIPGLRPGSKVRLRGQVGIRDGKPVMINPAYELLAPGEAGAPGTEPGFDTGGGRDRRDEPGR